MPQPGPLASFEDFMRYAERDPELVRGTGAVRIVPPRIWNQLGRIAGLHMNSHERRDSGRIWPKLFQVPDARAVNKLSKPMDWVVRLDANNPSARPLSQYASGYFLIVDTLADQISSRQLLDHQRMGETTLRFLSRFTSDACNLGLQP